MRSSGLISLALLMAGCPAELSPPTAPVISVSPSPALTGDDLTLSIDEPSVDVDGDPITYTTAWYVDDELVEDQTGDSVPATATAKGQQWRAVVTPSSAGDTGPSGESELVEIGDTPPSAPAVSVAAAATEDDVVAQVDTPSTDPDEDEVTYEISWSRDGTVDPAYTTDTVPASATAQGEAWEVTYTPVADGVPGPAASASVVIGDTPPSAPTVSIAASATTSEDIAVFLDTPSTDVDGDAITYAYAWFLDDTLDPTQTDATLSAAATAKGQSWRVVVTPTANGADGESGTSGDVAIVDTPPTPPTVSIAATAQTGDDVPLTIDVESTDIDGDVLTYDIAWFNADTQVGAYDGLTTLPAAATAKGQMWTVQVTPVADGVSGTTATSEAVVITDTPPSQPVVSVVSSARTADVITVSIDVASTDVDGDAVTYDIAWSRDGVVVDGLTDLDLQPSETAKGDSWTVAVTPVADGTSGVAGVSAAVDIIDTPPTAPVVSLGPDPARADESLTVSIDEASTDVDDDDVTYTYAWFVDGTPRSSLSGDTVDASQTQVGELWSVRVTPVADGVSGPAADSNDVPIAALNGFFVRSQATYGGDLGSLSGADALCLDQLTSTDWLGKSQAQTDGLLDADHVQAFLCTVGQCQGPLPSTDYLFAQAGDASIGGASFTTDSLGRGPGDRERWDGPTYFGSSAQHWSGRGQGTGDLWDTTGDVLNCFNWQVETSETWGGVTTGASNSNSSSRWSRIETRCSNPKHLVCVVQPIPVIAQPSACITPWGEEVADGDSVEAWQDAVACETSCVSETRTCTDGELSGSFEQLSCAEPSASVCEDRGYLVKTDSSYSGDLGGLAGANAECLAELTREDWRGKDAAGTLTVDRVEAFLCDETTCQDPDPDRIYDFATAGWPQFGGEYFLTDERGAGPGDVGFWGTQDRFGFTSFWWSGRAAGEADSWSSEPTAGSTCNGWTVASGFAVRGHMINGGPVSGTARWSSSGRAGCATLSSLLCMVHPEE